MAAGASPEILIEAPSEEARRLWGRALALAGDFGEGPTWALIGGMMVQLHAAEHRRQPRFTDDIDVLGDSRRRPPATRLIPGATQALNRSEVVMVSIDGAPPVAVRRPDLLGAILIKARAVAQARREKFESDRQDLVLLLSLVADPRALAASSELKSSEQRWLRDIEEDVAFADPALQSLFDPETLTRARLAFRLLAESRL